MSGIYQALEKRYPSNAYTLMCEVSDKAGFERSRSADYMVMSLWPSRGNHLTGIELKSHRSDWLNELKNPAKAETFFQYCDYFWLLTENDTVAKENEIPPTWGWMTLKGEVIRVMKEAPRLEPKPVTKSFLAALLKRASDKSGWIERSSIDDKLREAREQGERNMTYRQEQTMKELTELRALLSKFKQASGLDLDGYDRWRYSPDKIGAAVKFICEGGVDGFEQRLTQLKTMAEVLNKDIANAVSSIKKVNEAQIQEA